VARVAIEQSVESLLRQPKVALPVLQVTFAWSIVALKTCWLSRQTLKVLCIPLDLPLF
jgi:hypothetical protein